MERVTQYTQPHSLIQEALGISLEDYVNLIKKMNDSNLYLLMSELNQACDYIVDAVSNTTKFEVKPSPIQFEDAQKMRPIIEEMQKELELCLKQKEAKDS